MLPDLAVTVHRALAGSLRFVCADQTRSRPVGYARMERTVVLERAGRRGSVVPKPDAL
jgi:hypothetical protein